MKKVYHFGNFARSLRLRVASFRVRGGLLSRCWPSLRTLVCSLTRLKMNATEGEPMMPDNVDWELLARTQENVIERATEKTEDGLVFALEDRNFTSQLRCRPVLVRVHPSVGEAHVFDQWGRILDEPESGVKLGVQAFDEFAKELASWDAKLPNGGELWYYRVPKLRELPRQRNPPRLSSNPQSPAQVRVVCLWSYSYSSRSPHCRSPHTRSPHSR